jgi:hypothetical protein
MAFLRDILAHLIDEYHVIYADYVENEKLCEGSPSYKFS